ncbi:MAG: hypothetical protein M3Z03_15515 [Actinomycetota bacterium]|nr:hypothetical protein [Actinomycetota bacterium]
MGIVLGVAVAGTGIYLAAGWNRTTRVELADVLDDFRASSSASVATSTTSAPPSSTVAPAVAAPLSEAGSTATIATVPATVPPTTVAGPAPFARPPAGVYTFRASGGERISVGGASHTYPAEVYAALTHTACGYRLKLQVIEEHIDTLELCVDDRRLSFASSHQRMTFLGNTAEGSFACNPPIVLIDRAAGVGSERRATCDAGSIAVVSSATHTTDGVVPLDGEQVPTSRASWRWSAHGETTGDGEFVFTFDDRGMLVALSRDTTTTAPSILGRATHEESARFELRSRIPQQ